MAEKLSNRIIFYTFSPLALASIGIKCIAMSPVDGMGKTGRGVMDTLTKAKRNWNSGDGLLRTVSFAAKGTAKASINGLRTALSTAGVGCTLIIMAALIPPGGAMYEISRIVCATCDAIQNVASNLSLRVCNAVQSRYGNYNPANCN